MLPAAQLSLVIDGVNAENGEHVDAKCKWDCNPGRDQETAADECLAAKDGGNLEVLNGDTGE